MATTQIKTVMQALLKILMLVVILLLLYNKSIAQTNGPVEDFKKAEQLLDKGACERALDHVNAFISRRSRDFNGYLLRGMINECLENDKEAIVDYSLALELKPNNSEVLFNRAILRYQVGQYQMAINDLQTILSLPDQPTNVVYYKKQLADNGISGLSTMATMRSEVYNQLGLAHLELNNFHNAKLYFDSAIAIQPSSMYFSNRGLAFNHLDDHDSALDDFERALQLDSLNSSAMFNMLSMLEDKGSSDVKIKKLSVLIENNKSLPEIFVQRALAYYDEGNYSAAIEDYNAAIALESDNPDHFINRALAYQKLKRYKKAVDDLTYAIGLQSNYAKSYVNRGNVYFQMKNFDKAINDYDIALLQDPDNANVYYNRAMSWFSMENADKACADLKKASELGMDKADEYLNKKCLGQ